EALGVTVRRAIKRARHVGVLQRTPQAEARWSEIYCSLDDDIDGVIGSLTARAEAQMLRLSVCYALLDGADQIDVWHVDAARAVWEHCERSIITIFEGRPPDHVVAR